MTAPIARSVRRTIFMAVTTLALTFVLGVLAGVGIAPLLRLPPPGLSPGLAALGLRPAQRRQIEEIIARHGPEVEALMVESMPRLRAVQERVASEIESVLDEEQRAKFQLLRAKHPAPPPP